MFILREWGERLQSGEREEVVEMLETKFGECRGARTPGSGPQKPNGDDSPRDWALTR